MAKIMVRVRPGQRPRVDGATRVEGQTFWIDEERLKDIADEVAVVEGVKEPEVRNTAIDSPRMPISPAAMPQPDTRLLEPRKLPHIQREPEQDVAKPAEKPVVKAAVEQEKMKKPKKPAKKPVGYSKKK